MIPLETIGAQSSTALRGGESPIESHALTTEEEEELRRFADLAVQSELLEERCDKVWQEGLSERGLYRRIRQNEVAAPPNVISSHESKEPVDGSLITDLDSYFDALCDFYLRGSAENKARVRNLMESSKRLAGNLHNYAGRTAAGFKEVGSHEFLVRGLAATSIDGGRSGQEFDYILESLWKSALKLGRDPATAFSTVANMSEPEIRAILEKFGNSRGLESPTDGRDD
jgi:hypothetical protein